MCVCVCVCVFVCVCVCMCVCVCVCMCVYMYVCLYIWKCICVCVCVCVYVRVCIQHCLNVSRRIILKIWGLSPMKLIPVSTIFKVRYTLRVFSLLKVQFKCAINTTGTVLCMDAYIAV